MTMVLGSFAKSKIHWADCVIEDRGDGALILVPADVPKVPLVTRALVELAAAINGHNAGCKAPARMRLRVALHAGEVHHDAHGVAGAAINHAFRLVEAPALKSALAASHGLLAVIVSDWFFDGVVRHEPGADPDSYRQVQVAVKETETVGWIRLPDCGPAQSQEATASERDKPYRTQDTTAGIYHARAARGRVGYGGSYVDLPGYIWTDSAAAAGDDRWRRPVPAQLPHDVGGFTGREPELAALDVLAAAGESTAVVISAIDGAAGIGKPV